ncbi:MAG: FUSC family protein [Cellulosilyticaceae bacterium]
MLKYWKKKQEIDWKDIFQKGTVGILTTFLMGYLFGKENMMIAFVMVLGASVYDQEDWSVKKWVKFVRLVLFDTVIVCCAFGAGQNYVAGIIINSITIFAIIFLRMKPYDQISYKTFILLYVFCQYSSISISELPDRIMLVITTLFIIFISSWLSQSRKRFMLDPKLIKVWSLLILQVKNIQQNKFDEKQQMEINIKLNEVASGIYKSGYKQFLTTNKGKLNFQFYINLSHFSVKLKTIYKKMCDKQISEEEIQKLIVDMNIVEECFLEKKTIGEVISHLEIISKESSYICSCEIVEIFDGIEKAFLYFEKLVQNGEEYNFCEWKNTSKRILKKDAKQCIDTKSIKFNFALRMAIVLTIMLGIVSVLGFYKVIWVVIPIIAVTLPYYEETMAIRGDRFKSNVAGCILVVIVVEVISSQWAAVALIIIAFYGVYMFKDYYRVSFFLTILAICFSTFGIGVYELFFYRIIYLSIGLIVVGMTVSIKPFCRNDGIKELTSRLDWLNIMLNEEQRKEKDINENLVRNIILHSSMLVTQLNIHNVFITNEQIIEKSYNLLSKKN